MIVKFVSKTAPEKLTALWQPLLDAAHLPDDMTVTLDPEARSYDFLVVYEDLPPRPGESRILRRETIACHPANTLLITTEPSSIRIDGPNYMKQFGGVWTTKDKVFTPNMNRPASTPPLRFFYGHNMEGGPHRGFSKDTPNKTRDLSAMSSTKAMNHTLHAKRLSFITALKVHMEDDLALFGRGLDPVDDKADAMDDYRYHIAIENHLQSGHITEKLTDCFVAGCLPFYFGAPDYDQHFPKEAVIPIDIYDFDAAVQTIKQAIRTDEYSQRLDALKTARDITLKNWNTISAAAWLALDRFEPNRPPKGEILGRHAFRRKYPIKAASDAIFRMRMKNHPKASPLQG